MKLRTILIASAVFALGTSVFATPAEKITFLIHSKGGLKEHRDEISVLASSLTKSECDALYALNAKKIVLPACINIVPFGVGSWTQGDIKGGLILSGATLLTATGVAGFYVGMAGFLINGAVSSIADSDNGSTGFWAGVMITGGAVAVGSFIFYVVYSIVRPQSFGKAYNEVLANTLNGGRTNKGSSDVTFSPIVDFDAKKTTVGLAITY